MRRLSWWLLPWLLLGWLPGGALPALARDDADFFEPHEVRVEVTRRAEQWTAEYTFDRPAPAWLFPRTSPTRKGDAWRARTWIIETPGVRLERRGDFDVLEARRGQVPVKVRLRFTPLAEKLTDDYTPALRFTDGGVALFTGQFDLFPLQSAREATRLPSDLNGVPMPQTRLDMSFTDGGRVERHAGESPRYVFLGPTRAVETADVVTLLDPQLPAWIHGALARNVPELLAQYASQLGAPKYGRPTVIASWKGPTPLIMSRGGGALQNQIVMEYEGEGLTRETPERRAEELWFLAHEAAHFWLGQTVAYEFARDSWITEGGADLLALRVIAALKLPFDWRGYLNQSITDCATLTRRRGVESARDRNEHRAYYACGVVLGLVAEGASRKPFHVFVRRLVDDNRADALVSRADWLTALETQSRDRTLARDIVRLLERGDADPAAMIASLFKRAGVAFELDERRLPRIP
jgi:hypothetical protein